MKEEPQCQTGEDIQTLSIVMGLIHDNPVRVSAASVLLQLGKERVKNS